jgi:CheY-like chemotaxis protein
MMPVMDGAQLIGAMAAHADLKNIPVVIMSSVPEAAVRERCSGFSAYVAKPFKIFGLIDIVTGILDCDKS